MWFIRYITAPFAVMYLIANERNCGFSFHHSKGYNNCLSIEKRHGGREYCYEIMGDKEKNQNNVCLCILPLNSVMDLWLAFHSLSFVSGQKLST